MENKILRDIQKLLTNYFTYFKDDNILVVSEDKTVLPFAYLIFENSDLLLSLAVDYDNVSNVAEVSLTAAHVYPTLLSESFYISNTTGDTYFDEAAYDRYSLESIDLENIEPVSNELN